MDNSGKGDSKVSEGSDHLSRSLNVVFVDHNDDGEQVDYFSVVLQRVDAVVRLYYSCWWLVA